MPKRAKVCDIVVKEDFEGGGHGGQIIPGESAIGTGVLRQADVQRLSLNRTLKVKGHCIREMPSRTRRLSGGREEETFDGGATGEKRAAGTRESRTSR